MTSTSLAFQQSGGSPRRRKLKAIYWRGGLKRCLVFQYQEGRWTHVEKLYPWDIRDALQIGLTKVEEAVPGSLKKASDLDDREWQASTRRTRRFIAEAKELLYINSPHLQSQSERVCGYHVITNIPWRDVPQLLRLVCQAAEIECRPLLELAL